MFCASGGEQKKVRRVQGLGFTALGWEQGVGVSSNASGDEQKKVRRRLGSRAAVSRPAPQPACPRRQPNGGVSRRRCQLRPRSELTSIKSTLAGTCTHCRNANAAPRAHALPPGHRR